MNYKIRYSSSSLSHYGIKGQQWGERRFQNEDGSLTPEGMQRYGVGEGGKITSEGLATIKSRYREDKQNSDLNKKLIGNKKLNENVSERRKKLEQEYIEKGFTKEQAQIKAYNKENAEKILKIVGAVAVTAAVTYGVIKGRQLIRRYADRTIKQGTQLQRITTTPVEDMKRTVYVSPDQKDFVKYRGLYGKQIEQRNQWNKLFRDPKSIQTVDEGIYKITGTANSKMKIAGERTGKKVFDGLLKSDPEFKKDFDIIKREADKSGFYVNAIDYDKFNKVLGGLHKGDEIARAREKFYNALKKKGYSGLIDVNDRRYSGYYSKDPTIMFDFGKHVKNLGLTKMSSPEIDRDLKKAYSLITKAENKAMTIERIKAHSKNALLYGGGTGLSLWGTSKAIDFSDKRNGAYYRTIINEYKKEHPNTKLSDDKILENVLGA